MTAMTGRGEMMFKRVAVTFIVVLAAMLIIMGGMLLNRPAAGHCFGGGRVTSMGAQSEPQFRLVTR